MKLSLEAYDIHDQNKVEGANQVRYSTMSEVVLEELRRSILTGEFAPGEKINQLRVARKLGVSMIPLREALKRLQAEGYVTNVSHRGIKVKELSHEELEDIFLIRVELEELAAGLAAEHLTETDKEKLRNIFQKVKKARRLRKYDQLFLLNRDFQFTIYRACRREYLLKLLRDLWEQSSRYRNLATHRALEATSRAEEALAERECILRACDAETVPSYARQSVTTSSNRCARSKKSRSPFLAHGMTTARPRLRPPARKAEPAREMLYAFQLVR